MPLSIPMPPYVYLEKYPLALKLFFAYCAHFSTHFSTLCCQAQLWLLLNLKMHSVFDGWGIPSLNPLFPAAFHVLV